MSASRGREGVPRVVRALFCLAFLTLCASAVEAATSVVATIPTGGSAFGVGVNPNTNRVYVSVAGPGVLQVIDGASNATIASVPIATFVRGVGVNPTTNKIYVADYGNGGGSTVYRVDGVTHATLPIALPASSGPVWIGVNPLLNRVYAGNETNSNVTIINGAADTVITTVAVAGKPAGVGVHTGTGNIYVATDTNRVTVLDSAGVLVTNIGPAGFSAPQDVTVDSVANRAYVVNNGNNTLTVINTLTNTVLSTFSVGSSPIGVAVNSARNRAYVTNGGASNLSVVNLVTGGIEETVSLALGPRDAEYNPANDQIYVPTFADTRVFALQDVGDVCSTASGSWWNTNWHRRRQISINNGDIGENLVNFPLLVRLDPTRIDYSKTKANGDDLRFVDADDWTVLDYEIETWTPGGTSWIWVRVPQINLLSSDSIIMYYDNPAAAAGANPTGVWNSNHKGVWHLKENPGGAPPQMKDSTSNANHGTAENSPVQTAGQVNGSLQFDGTLDRDVNIPDTASLQMSTQMTISGWARTTNTDAQARLIVARWNTTGPSDNYWLGKLNTTQIAFGADGGGASTVFCNLNLISDGNWHYIVGVAETGGTMRMYVDGTQCSTATFTPPIQVGSSEVRIGRSPDATLQDWSGGIDEVRIENIARTPLWVFAQNRSVRDGYNTFGSEEGICYYRSIGSRVYGTGQALPQDGAGTTITATVGSRTVNGTGTAWITANRGRGDSITFGAFTGTVLAINSNTQLTLTSPATVGGTLAYTISRKFSTLTAWEDCIDGGSSCGPDPAVSTSLVTDNRGEIGIAYKDGVLAGGVAIDGTIANNTDAIHTITLTAEFSNRHSGIPGAGVVVDNGVNVNPAIRVLDDYVTVEWLEIQGGGGPGYGIEVDQISAGSGSTGASRITLRNNLIHASQYGIVLTDPDQVTDVYDNFVFGGFTGVRIIPATLSTWSRIRFFGNTVYNYSSEGFQSSVTTNPDRIIARNNISASSFPATPFAFQGPLNSTSSNNLSTLSWSGFDPSPAGGGLYNQVLDGQVNFVNRAANNLHIQTSSTAVNAGANLSGFFDRDIDSVIRLADPSWEIGGDDVSQTTAVELLSFTGAGRDGAVDLAWTTASELHNLGFHLYRAQAEAGPWTRINPAIIPGQGSSPTGASYAWHDSGLTNGTAYFYLLEDVETTGRTEGHGPVSVTPGVAAPGGSGDGGGTEPGRAYGDPKSSYLRVLERTSRGALLELRTGGFYAIPEGDGTVRIVVPGFEESGDSGLPVKRGIVEAVAGAKVRLASVESSEESSYDGLSLAGARKAEIVAGDDGTLQISNERRPRFRAAAQPAASLEGTLFQGEVKKARVGFSPFRVEGGRLLLSGRIRVRLEYTGREAGETRRVGVTGRRAPLAWSARGSGVLAQLVVADPGLYRVTFEDLFGPGRSRRSIAESRLRLSRQGERVAYHVTPDGSRFGPGSALLFVSEGSSLNPEGETVYELAEGGDPLPMAVVDASASGTPLDECLTTETWEQNNYYQAGLVDADDLWQWDLVISPGVLSVPFSLSEVSLSSSSPAPLTVWLQGASDFEAAPDHHLRFRVNGVAAGETRFDGRKPKRVDTVVAPGVLREGGNLLEIEDVGDTGALYSMVFLDRFSLRYPRRLRATAGRLEGAFPQAGRAEVDGISSAAIVVDTTEPATRWISGAVPTPQGVAFAAAAGRRYLVTDAVQRPLVRTVLPSTLRSAGNQADYLVVGPQAYLDAAQPLLDHRRAEGLTVKAVSTEEIFQEFGHGEPGARPIREFLAFAYQTWAAPSVRYVLLLGDATYDPKDYLKTGVGNPVPALITRTTYLWTASDPTYAAVNGEDAIPDVALGRLSAASGDEVRALVEKVLAFESGGQTLQGRSVLVADNPDLAGDFERDADELASTVLATHEPRKIYLSREGANTRTEIEQAFGEGASLLSYMGHGGTAVWASENIFNNWDVAGLAPQAAQPLLITLNCLNGFFHFPPVNSLSEALLKVEGKGAVAAFSPSGLSQNEPARVYHRVLLEEILSGRHDRLGDALLAAQSRYADSGALPELLSVYQLLGDPALRIR